MKNRIGAIVLAALTGLILIYAAVRFGIGGDSPRKIIIRQDIGNVSPGVRRFLSENIDKVQNSPAELLRRFPDIEQASVKNEQNGIIEMRLKYKKIIGVWLAADEKALYPLLENGEIIDAPYLPKTNVLPDSYLLFKGKIPSNVGEIAKIVKSYSELAKKAAYLEYIEGRRWNIKIIGGGTIMLPEQNVQGAIDQIKALGVLNKSFNILDLRGGGQRPLVKF